MVKSAVKITESPGAVRIAIHAQPNAKKTESAGLHADSLKLKVHAPPVDGAANEEICRFFSKTFRIPLRSVRIIQGELSRAKVVELEGVSRELVESWLENS
jgi:hypothetical protein